MFQDLSGFWLGAWVGMVKINAYMHVYSMYTHNIMPSWKLSTQVGLRSMVVTLLGLIDLPLNKWMFDTPGVNKNYPF